MKYGPCRLVALGLVGALLFPSADAYPFQGSDQVLQNIASHSSVQDFGAAMEAAAGLEPESLRSHHSALLLYKARSYDAALEHAMAAISGGDRDEQLLLTAVSAAIWILDTTTAQYCQQLLVDRLLVMDAEGVANYGWYETRSLETAQMVGDLALGDRSTDAAIRRAKVVGLAALGAALIGLFLARAQAK